MAFLPRKCLSPFQHRIPLLSVPLISRLTHPTVISVLSILFSASPSFLFPHLDRIPFFSASTLSRPPTNRLAFPAQTVAFFTLSIYPDLCSSLVITAPFSNPFAEQPVTPLPSTAGMSALECLSPDPRPGRLKRKHAHFRARMSECWNLSAG